MTTTASPRGDALHVELSLDVHADPIRGTARLAAAEYPFSGWLSLITTLDRLRERAAADERT